MERHRDAQRSRLTPRTDTPGGRRHRAARGLAGRSQPSSNVGCGEDWWTPDLPGYLGLDVAPEAIEAAKRNHPDRGTTSWTRSRRGARRRPGRLPRRDAAPDRLTDGLRLLDAICGLAGQWLLASTYVGAENIDIVTGDAYSPNLEAEPFNLPPAAAAHPRRLRVPRRRPPARPREDARPLEALTIFPPVSRSHRAAIRGW